MTESHSMDSFAGEWELKDPVWVGGMFGDPVWDFWNDKNNPLTLCLDGSQYRPDNHIKTDLGSVPRFLQRRLPKWFDRARYPRSYIFHDNIYHTGGVWKFIAGQWIFCILTRIEADEMLRRMCIIEGASRANAAMIYYGVRLGGWASWDEKAQIKERG